MSVSTECSFRTESDWDPQSESSSMISFDMTQPDGPTSPSRHLKVGFHVFMMNTCKCETTETILDSIMHLRCIWTLFPAVVAHVCTCVWDRTHSV